MSLFGSIGRGIAAIARPAGRAVGTIARSPVARALPVVGTAATVYQAGSAMFSKGGGLPALPGAGLPALPGTAMAPAIVGKRGIFRDDANVPDALKPYVISRGDLKVSYRSPLRGYVIMHDGAGDPYAVPKQLAKLYLGWKPHRKPPISVGEMQALKKAQRTVKKVKHIHGLISYVAANTTDGGKVKIHRSKKGGHK